VWNTWPAKRMRTWEAISGGRQGHLHHGGGDADALLEEAEDKVRQVGVLARTLLLHLQPDL
jgi:hypothetical protein